MLSKSQLLAVFLLIEITIGSACSGISKGFCYVHAMRSADVVLTAVISAEATNSVQLQVLEVLSGTETRSLITVWDGKDINCTKVFPMNASGMGNVGDTMLMILPLITNTINTWDVIGDYRRPSYLFEEPILKVKNDSVYGLINAKVTTGGPYWSVQKMKYIDFKTYWQSHQNDCQTLVGLASEAEMSTFELKSKGNQLEIKCAVPTSYRLQISNLVGQVIVDEKRTDSTLVYFSENGVQLYLVSLQSSSGETYRQLLKIE